MCASSWKLSSHNSLKAKDCCQGTEKLCCVPVLKSECVTLLASFLCNLPARLFLNIRSNFVDFLYYLSPVILSQNLHIFVRNLITVFITNPQGEENCQYDAVGFDVSLPLPKQNRYHFKHNV